ncbi:hypothetical protein B296_00055358 [Ensete ventricosum]|uniref:Uncharacterized protein n=1 Tax=Ensete ventricosum TaxID=4639 RepID=A0A426XME2_ENSVE|nr:hypothetical protein B296_00055358 [Ensete ventricosum]
MQPEKTLNETPETRIRSDGVPFSDRSFPSEENGDEIGKRSIEGRKQQRGLTHTLQPAVKCTYSTGPIVRFSARPNPQLKSKRDGMRAVKCGVYMIESSVPLRIRIWVRIVRGTKQSFGGNGPSMIPGGPAGSVLGIHVFHCPVSGVHPSPLFVSCGGLVDLWAEIELLMSRTRWG